MQVPRRQFLLAGLAASRLPAKPAAPATLFDRGFAQVTRIADGVYANLYKMTYKQEQEQREQELIGEDAAFASRRKGEMAPSPAASARQTAASSSDAMPC